MCSLIVHLKWWGATRLLVADREWCAGRLAGAADVVIGAMNGAGEGEGAYSQINFGEQDFGPAGVVAIMKAVLGQWVWQKPTGAVTAALVTLQVCFRWAPSTAPPQLRAARFKPGDCIETPRRRSPVRQRDGHEPGDVPQHRCRALLEVQSQRRRCNRTGGAPGLGPARCVRCAETPSVTHPTRTCRQSPPSPPAPRRYGCLTGALARWAAALVALLAM